MIQELRSPAIAQILAAAGFDFFFIDMEHGSYDLTMASDIIKTGRLEGVCPLVRAPDIRYSPLSRILDIGALGVMVPRVRTKEDVEYIVNKLKYPPHGQRGCSITGGNNDYRSEPVSTFIKAANRETMVIIQVELSEAVEDIDALLSVPGVDVALLGLGDLSISLGVPGQSDHPKVLQAGTRVIDACGRHNVVPGIHQGSADALVNWIERGVRMVTWSTDIWMLLNGGTDAVRYLRNQSPSN
jgi:2-keto-3-deoxy-L-rhamnonate aldolase RhmA